MPKNWLITGTNTGIGRTIVEQLLCRGDRVVATLRQEGPLDDLKDQFSHSLVTMTMDLTDVRTIKKSVQSAFSSLGRIDVAVSNAGYALFGAGEEVSDGQIDRQIATNLTGSIQFIRAVLPHMRAQGGGRIVQISSEGGQVAYPNFSLYHATKWGIEGFIQSVSQEVAPFDIDFLIAEPGPTSTNFAAGIDHAKVIEAYDSTPAGDVRRALNSGSFGSFSDVERTVGTIIACADETNPPLRLALGASTYRNIRSALNARLDMLERNKLLTISVDSL